MCLVSGLEEQNSETYPRVIKLLDKLCDATDKSAIFHAMWKSLSLNPSTRIGAVHYLQERLPKTKSPEGMSCAGFCFLVLCLFCHGLPNTL
jgi:hypothetical protein